MEENMKTERVIEPKFSGRITAQDVANVIDHSLLQPDITVRELKEGCETAQKYHCVSVCVRPSDLEIAAKELKDTDILVTTVIGFPHGTTTTKTKVCETIDAVENKAKEVDMVLNICRLKSGEWDYVRRDIAEVVKAAHQGGALVKVILENYYLSREEKIRACQICGEVEADYVKTSSGYAAGGATLEDLRLMRRYSPNQMKIKAAGGVRNLDQALAIMATGTVRIGTRATVEIMEEARKREREGTLMILPDDAGE